MERLSHYDIVRRLGQGGMGEVYEAVDLDLGRHVALKFVAPAAAGDPDALRRLEREARAAAALHHPRIATLFAFDRTTERPFLAMELLRGPTLRDVLAGGPLPVDEALAIARDVAEGLAFAHRHGVVHRDVKPGNLMFDEAGAIKITDFGLARTADASHLTVTGASLGTPSYMAPETLGADAHAEAGAAGTVPAAAPADVFALGVTLFEMLAGALPFGGDRPLAMMYAIANDPPRPLRAARPEVAEEVERLVGRMLAKEPHVRPPAATAMQELAHLTRWPPAAPYAVAARAAAAAAGAEPTAATLPPRAAPVGEDTRADTRMARPATEELTAQPLAGARAVVAAGPHSPARRPPITRRGAVLGGLAALLVVTTIVPWWRGRLLAGRERLAVALVNEGHDSLSAGRPAAARSRFEAALRLAPRYGEAKLDLATVLAQQGERDRAAALDGQVIAENPRRAELRAAAEYGLGGIDLESGALGSAIAHLGRAARLDSARVEYPNNLGYALIAAGRTDEALATLRAARARFPGTAGLRKNEALAWFASARFDSAAAAAGEAVRLAPAHAEAWAIKARSEAALGDLRAAGTSLAALRGLQPPAALLSEVETAVRAASRAAGTRVSAPATRASAPVRPR